ncbi:MAG: hypothetical protein GY708_09865 [Actinomycetia bacterium]|nr:hypothetical protein [Actinomycetes bacterium]MCP4957961.1 hypothetical protein [Actinomycetes bacterium]
MRWATAIAAGCAVVLIAAVLYTVTRPEPSAASVEAVVSDAMAFVEQTRGLELERAVPVHIMNDAEFEQITGADASLDDEALVLLAAQQRALGMATPADFAEALESDADTNILGLYTHRSQSIMVRDVPADDALTATIVHELVHALQDEHFSLTGRGEMTSDESMAFSSLIEGEASYVMHAWSDANGYTEENEGDYETQIPLGMIVSGTMPYIVGPIYVATETEGDIEAMNALHGSPPRSSAQVVRPWLEWDDQPSPTPIRFDDLDGEVLIVDSWGGIQLTMAVAAVTGDPALGWTTGAAWANDEFITFERSDSTVCVVWNIAARVGYRGQLQEGLEAYAEALPDASVVGTTLTSCDPETPDGLVGPSAGIDTLIHVSTGMAMLSYLGADESADCAVTRLLETGELETIWYSDDPLAHPTTIEAIGSCA